MSKKFLDMDVEDLRAEVLSLEMTHKDELEKLRADNAALLAACKTVRKAWGPESFGETVDMLDAAIKQAERSRADGD